MTHTAGSVVQVRDRMQRTSYTLAVAPGTGIDPRMSEAIPPERMLRLGVFEGCYLRDCRAEFPAEWFARARLSTLAHGDITCNRFRVRSRLPLAEWRRRGWIVEPDPRGWFQWWCRYWMGRRIPDVDAHQIARWRAIVRHRAQVDRNCHHTRDARGRCTEPMTCRPRQRQALLQWARNPF